MANIVKQLAIKNAAGEQVIVDIGAKAENIVFSDGSSLADKDFTENITEMTGASSTDAGAAGLVIKPLAGDENKYLRGDGTWADGPIGPQGEKGDKGDTGEGFSVFKTYSSITNMENDKDNVEEGKFVLITSDVEDEDNAKLYVRDMNGFSFLTDLSGAQGIKGEQGDQGETGATYTPTVSQDGDLSWTNDKSLSNPQTVNIKGPKGDPGDQGEAGAVFTPSVDADGNITWTNNKELQNPSQVNIKGPKGDPGDKGDQGDPFSIFKTYPSITEMGNDLNNVPEGKFVVIQSTIDNEDNAKLYQKQGMTFTYICNMSGPKGEKGEDAHAIDATYDESSEIIYLFQ